MIRKLILASIIALFTVTAFFVTPANANDYFLPDTVSQHYQPQQQIAQANQRFQDDQSSQYQSSQPQQQSQYTQTNQRSQDDQQSQKQTNQSRQSDQQQSQQPKQADAT